MSATVKEPTPSDTPSRRRGETDRRPGGRTSSGRSDGITVEQTGTARPGGRARIAAGTAASQSSGRSSRMLSAVDLRSVVTSRKRSRAGGVAPFVPPARRMSRRLRMREWNRRGFVALSPGKQKLRHRILPRTVIGISFMLMTFGVGGAFAGAAFYAYYDDRLAENERTVARFVEGFDQQFADAAGLLDEMRVDAVTDIRRELTPLEEYVSDADGVISLPASAGPSVWLLETRDERGEIVNGSAFAVAGHEGGTALVTSYRLISASTVAPSPAMDLIKGDERIPAQLWSWDKERDLALVIVGREIEPLALASEREQIDAVGARLFALSGFGGQGATASPGVLLDHSPVGLQHTAPVGTLFRGGPLLTGEGKVVGVASNDYRPFGLDPGQVGQAPDLRGMCELLLACAEFDRDLGITVDPDLTVEVAADASQAPPRGDGPVRDGEQPAGEASDEPASIDQDTTEQDTTEPSGPTADGTTTAAGEPIADDGAGDNGAGDGDGADG